jgi:hypothetical protein
MSKFLSFLAFLGFAQSLEQGLTEDFSTWLSANGYEDLHFQRPDLTGGAYGGKASADEKITH